MSDSADSNAQEIYRYPRTHKGECKEGCKPADAKAGEIFRFIYYGPGSSNDERLHEDHYVLVLPERYKTAHCRESYPCLVITTHLLENQKTRLCLFEQQKQVPNCGGSAFEPTEGITEIHLRPQTFNRTGGEVGSTSWLWKYNTCINIYEARMIKKGCLHVVKPDFPDFGLCLSDNDLQSVLRRLEEYTPNLQQSARGHHISHSTSSRPTRQNARTRIPRGHHVIHSTSSRSTRQNARTRIPRGHYISQPTSFRSTRQNARTRIRKFRKPAKRTKKARNKMLASRLIPFIQTSTL